MARQARAPGRRRYCRRMTVDWTALEDQLQVEREKVDVSAVSFSVREIVRMFEEHELSIAPSYQRKYRWPEAVASTFIESVFLGLPIPPIFVATNDDFELEVVDGLQRISTLLMFMAQRPEHLAVIHRASALRLQGLEVLDQLNGNLYSEMPQSLQRYFARQPLQVIALTDKSDKEVRFQLFERLNSGAISLSPQEVRAAVYRGQFSDFLERMAANADFSGLLKLQETNKHDGTAAEQVLKYFAYKNHRENFNGAVTKFLNEYAAAASQSFNYATEEELFVRTFAFLAGAVGGPFVRQNTPVTPLVQFEACGVAVGELLASGHEPQVPPVGWLEDSELVASSTGGSNTRSMLKRRVERAAAIFQGE